jgi:hypothetical protein
MKEPLQVKHIKVVVQFPLGRSSDGFFYFLEYQGIDIDNLDVNQTVVRPCSFIARDTLDLVAQEQERMLQALVCVPLENKQCTLHSRQFQAYTFVSPR